MPLMNQLPSAAVVQALRAALSLTQKRLAALAGVNRVEIIAVEKGRNRASSVRMRDGLATAFHLTGEEMTQALTGAITVKEVLKLVSRRVTTTSASRRRRAA
jgi:DNA-binding XRE family transcriptional regulator